MTTLAAFFAALGAIGGIGGLGAFAYIGVTRQKLAAEARKIGVEADDLLSGKALAMYDRAMKAAEAAEAKADKCREEMDALRDHVDKLERLMRDEGMTPPPFRWPIGGRP